MAQNQQHNGSQFSINGDNTQATGEETAENLMEFFEGLLNQSSVVNYSCTWAILFWITGTASDLNSMLGVFCETMGKAEQNQREMVYALQMKVDEFKNFVMNLQENRNGYYNSLQHLIENTKRWICIWLLAKILRLINMEKTFSLCFLKNHSCWNLSLINMEHWIEILWLSIEQFLAQLLKQMFKRSVWEKISK